MSKIIFNVKKNVENELLKQSMFCFLYLSVCVGIMC